MQSSSPTGRLVRQLGPATAGLVVVASMIGTGIFGNTGKIQADVGDPGFVMLLWFVGGIFALAGALCYAELAALMPHAGGEYVYIKNIFGRLWSFVSGWVSFLVGFAAPAAGAAILSAEYLAELFVSIDPASPTAVFFGDPIYRKVYAGLLILVFSGVHIYGVESGSRIQNALTVIKLMIVGVFLAAGFAILGAELFSSGGLFAQGFTAPESGMQPVPTSADTLAAGSGLASSLPSWSALAIGLLWVSYAYSGWNGATYLAEEIRNPERNLPRALALSTVFTMVLFLLLNALYFLAAPAEELAGKHTVAAIAALHLFGAEISVLFNAAFCLILLSSISAYVMIGPRVYFAMARDNLFFSYAKQVHPKFGTPVASIICQATLSLLYIFTGTYDSIMTFMGFGLLLFPLLAVIGLIVHRLRYPDADRPYRSPFFPALPIVFIVFSLFIMVGSFLQDPIYCFWALGIALAGIPVYFLWTWAHRRWLENRAPAIVPD